MPHSNASPSRIGERLARWAAGEPVDSDALIEHTCERLLRLTRKLLRAYPGVRRWEQTDDVFQNAMLRLLQAMKAVRPESVRHFLALGALQIRRELIDLKRHYYGPEGVGAKHTTNAHEGSDERPQNERTDRAADPRRLAERFEFHELVDSLPDHERDVLDLVYYQGLDQVETAAVLGVTTRTVQNRRNAALMRLREKLKGEWPIS